MIYNIVAHECRRLFKTGKIFILLALCQCLLGLIFHCLLSEFQYKIQAAILEPTLSLGLMENLLHPLFAWNALIFLFITPLLAAQSFSQERKSHTLVLYFSAPLSALNLVLGKVIGLILGHLFLLLPLILMTLFLALQQPLDLGHLFAASCGLFAFMSANIALSIMVSCASKDPTICMLMSFVLVLFLSLLEWLAPLWDSSLEYWAHFSTLYHCKSLLSGLLNTQALIYYLLLIGTCLCFSVLRLEKECDFQ